LARIVQRSAAIFQISITADGALEIGRRSRGTPRIANRLLRRVRDFAMVEGDRSIDHELARAALDRLEVDQLGLDHMDRRILMALIQKFGGGPAGVKTIATACAEEVRTLEEIYEPYLIQCGFLKRTARGRVATGKAYQHLKIIPESE
jgi:Holliday junction DNA helicase RuvB